MKVVADESVDRPIVDALRASGHHVIDVAEASPGLTDTAVLRIAEDQAAVLMTQDRDFGELVFRLGRASHGVLLIRLHGLAAGDKADRVNAAILLHGDKLPLRFAVLNRQGLRIRGLPHV